MLFGNPKDITLEGISLHGESLQSIPSMGFISIGERLARLVNMQNVVTMNTLVEGFTLDILRKPLDLV